MSALQYMDAAYDRVVGKQTKRFTEAYEDAAVTGQPSPVSSSQEFRGRPGTNRTTPKEGVDTRQCRQCSGIGETEGGRLRPRARFGRGRERRGAARSVQQVGLGFHQSCVEAFECMQRSFVATDLSMRMPGRRFVDGLWLAGSLGQ